MFVAFGLILVLSAGVANYFISGSFDLVSSESIYTISALYGFDVFTSLIMLSFFLASNKAKKSEADRGAVRLSRLYFLICLIPVFGGLIWLSGLFLWAIKSAFFDGGKS